MNEIKKLIAELFALGLILSDYDDPNWSKKYDQAINDMTAKIDQLKALAKANNTLVGRAIFIPHADGSALYIVIKTTATKATLQWCPWVDSWQDDVLEGGATVALKWATERIRGADEIERIFPARPFNTSTFGNIAEK